MAHSVVMKNTGMDNYFQSVESTIMNSINNILLSGGHRFDGFYSICEYSNNTPGRIVTLSMSKDFVNLAEKNRPGSTLHVHNSKSVLQISEMISLALGVDPDGFNRRDYINDTEEVFYKLTHIFFIDVKFASDGNIKMPPHLVKLIHTELKRGDIQFRSKLTRESIESTLDITNGGILFTFGNKYGRLNGKSFLIKNQ